MVINALRFVPAGFKPNSLFISYYTLYFVFQFGLMMVSFLIAKGWGILVSTVARSEWVHLIGTHECSLLAAWPHTAPLFFYLRDEQ